LLPQQRAKQIKQSKPTYFEIEKRNKKEAEYTATLRQILPRELRDVVKRLNGVQPRFPDFSFNYKFYIEHGNNGALVKQMLLTRAGWISAESKEAANFIWTQWHDAGVFAELEKGDTLPHTPLPSLPLSNKDLNHQKLKATIPKKRLDTEFAK
jgi:hypothetical protein